MENRSLPRTSRSTSAVEGSVAGRVLYAGSGAPVRGAEVELTGPGGVERRVETGPAGLFSFSGLPEGTGYAVAATFASYATARRTDLTVEAGESANAGSLRLGAPIELVFHVQDGSGRAVKGAEVRVFTPPPRAPDLQDLDLESMADSVVRTPIAEARADASGDARFPALAVGLHEVSATAPGYARGVVTVSLSPRERRRTAVVTLMEGYTLRGTVTDAEGRPVEGRVVAAPVFDRDVDYLRQESEIDRHGHYRFDHLYPRQWDLVVYHKNGAPVPIAEVPVPEVERYDIHLGGRFVLRGKVSDASGSPVAGARVRALVSGLSQTTLGAGATTKADGTYEIDDLPAWGFSGVQVRKGGYAPYPGPDDPRRTRDLTLRGVVRVDVTLTKGVTLTGIVTAQPGGRPIAGARVLAVTKREAEPASGAGTTDSEGRYTIHGLAPWKYVLVVRADGCFQPGLRNSPWQSNKADPGRFTVLLDGTERRVVKDLVLERGGRVSGRVVGRSGEAVVGAKVTLHGPKGETVDSRVVSGPDGTFELTGVPSGKGLSVAAWEPWATGASKRFDLVAGGAVSGIRVAMPAPARVSGRVTLEDGSSIEGGVVRVVPTGLDMSFLSDLFGRGHPIRSDGTFSVTVPFFGGSDAVRVEAYVPGHPVGRSAVLHPARGQTVTGVRIRLTEGVSIQGRVEDEAGAPIAGATVRLMRHAGSGKSAPPTLATVSNADGSFVLSGIPFGAYPLQATARGYGEVEVRVSTDSPNDVLLVLAKGRRIQGTVCDGRGDPVPGMMVVASEKHRWQATTSGPDGSFVLSGLPDGTYTIRAEPWVTDLPYLPATVQGVRPGGRQVTLCVKRGYSISGRVVDSKGEPLTGIDVEAGWTDISGKKGFRSSKTGPDGKFDVSGLPSGDVSVGFLPGPGYGRLRMETQAGTTGIAVTLGRALSIRGQVLNPDGKGVFGVAVYAYHSGVHGFLDGVGSTNESGAFQIPGLAAGSYRLKIQVFGYASAEKDVAAGDTSVMFRLHRH